MGWRERYGRKQKERDVMYVRKRMIEGMKGKWNNQL